MKTLIKTLILICLFAVPSAAQDDGEKAAGSDAKQSQQLKDEKKAKKVEEVLAFVDEHFPGTTAELDAIREDQGDAAYEAVYSEQVEIYEHYQRILRSGGEDMAMLVIEQNKMYDELQILLDRYDALDADDPARVEARANAEPLLAKSKAFGGVWAEHQLASIKDSGKHERAIAGLEKKIAKMDALRADPKKVFDDYIAYKESVIKDAQETKKKLPENWHTDPAEAMAAAKKSGKPIHVFCSATWCGPCKVMVKNVFPLEEVQEALEDYEPLYADGDVHGIFVRKYHVRAFPTSIIIDANGEFLHRCDANGMNAEEFLEWLNEHSSEN